MHCGRSCYVFSQALYSSIHSGPDDYAIINLPCSILLMLRKETMNGVRGYLARLREANAV